MDYLSHFARAFGLCVACCLVSIEGHAAPLPASYLVDNSRSSMDVDVQKTAVSSIDSTDAVVGLQTDEMGKNWLSRRQNVNVALGLHRWQGNTAKVHRVNIGLWNNVQQLSGFQLGVFSAGVRQNMRGVNLALGASVVQQDAVGMTVAGVMNAVGGEMKGVQWSAFSKVAGRVKGVQAAGFSNLSLQPLQGLQLSGVSNISQGGSNGVQMAVLANVASGAMSGLQLGAYNYTDTLRGAQVGLINVSYQHVGGVQVGLFNVKHDSLGAQWGLVNINPATQIDLLLFAGNTSKFNSALRFRNRHTYTTIGIGTHYMGLDDKFSGALFYRRGAYLSLGHRWMLGADLGFQHIETFSRAVSLKPSRLFSLQAHVNLDCQITPRVGAFASVGYGHTRYYSPNSIYKNEWMGQIGVSLAYRRNQAMHSTERHWLANTLQDTLSEQRMALPEHKRPWLAAAEAAGINVLVFSHNRFISNADYAHISLNSIRRNLRTLPVWDNDPFKTNLFMHPYHGSLYFNAARSNGLSFWESVPYALGGSLMWEYFGENEPPALNDLFATSLGGTCLGEVSNRISRILLNDRSRGLARVLREVGAFIANPIQVFNRALRGDMWRVRSQHYLYHDVNRIPLDFRLSLGNRYLADNGAFFRGEHNPYINLLFEYGDIFNDRENKPFDYFSADLTIGLSGNQPRVSRVHLLGRLWTAPVMTGKRVKTEWGVFQHFNFYDSAPVKDRTEITPYRISEAVGIGPGIVYRLENKGSLSVLEQHLYTSLILLGGSQSDYYSAIAPRDYNMGGGYSFKSRTALVFPRLVRFVLQKTSIISLRSKGMKREICRV